jgi:hypothetical protein
MSLLDCPSEIVQHCFQGLSFADLMQVRAVCKRLAQEVRTLPTVDQLVTQPLICPYPTKRLPRQYTKTYLANIHTSVQYKWMAKLPYWCTNVCSSTGAGFTVA